MVIGTQSPALRTASPKRPTIRSRSAALEPNGIRSSSCSETPHAPTSASRVTISSGSIGGRVGSPNGSPPRWPTVHRPNVKRSSGVASYCSSIESSFARSGSGRRGEVYRAPRTITCRQWASRSSESTSEPPPSRGSRSTSTARCSRAPRQAYDALDAASRLGRAGSRPTGGGRPSGCWPRCAPAAGGRAESGSPGQMHGLVALDGGDRVLRPAILWNDQRTAAECREIEATIGLERLIELTGNRALPGFTAPKLLWMRQHEPSLYEQIRRIALPKDYVRLRLCGEHATDVSDASGTLLLDVAGRRWSDEVLERARARPGDAARGARGPGVQRQDRRRRSGRRRRRRPGGGRDRSRRRPGRARCPSRSAPRASCSPASSASPPTRRRASTPSATPSPASGTRWA